MRILGASASGGCRGKGVLSSGCPFPCCQSDGGTSAQLGRNGNGHRRDFRGQEMAVLCLALKGFVFSQICSGAAVPGEFSSELVFQNFFPCEYQIHILHV